jgi:hypothetical protein
MADVVVPAPLRGIWLGASYALGKPAPVAEPYPHICGAAVVGRMTGRQVRLWRRDCAACLTEAREPPEPTGDLPPTDPDVTAEEARRLGEHD